MKKLNPSPSANITIEPNLEVDDNFKTLLDMGINYISQYYKNDKFTITNNLKADPKGLSVFVKSDTPGGMKNLVQSITQIKVKYPNINYNQQNNLLSYTQQQQSSSKNQETTTNTSNTDDNKEALAKQLYGNVAQQFMSKTMGLSEQIVEEINRIKELL